MNSANHVEKRKPRGKPKLIRRRPRHPAIRLSPYAWAKLTYLRDVGPTEIGGFGIARSDDLLLLEDIRLIRQRCDVASVELDDESVADFFDEQVELGRRPEEFARVWVHTHPGNSPQPSSTDEETFARVFRPCDWAVMLIVACSGATYARLRFRAGPGGDMTIPVQVAYDVPFAGSDYPAWEAEYLTCVHSAVPPEPAAALWPDQEFESASYLYDDYYRDLEGQYGF